MHPFNLFRWILYTEKNYKGNYFVLQDGDQHASIFFGVIYKPFENLGNRGCASSLKLLDCKVSIELLSIRI